MMKFFESMKGQMVVVTLLLLFGLEIVTLFFTPPFDQGDMGAERWSETETLGSYESPLRLSEIDGPRIDDTAAMIVVTEEGIPGELWMFLVLAYVALLVFNFSYTFEKVTAPQWGWELCYTIAIVWGWALMDPDQRELWFPFMILKSGLILFALYGYLLERRLHEEEQPTLFER